MPISSDQRDKNTENKMKRESERGFSDAEKGKYRPSQKGSSEKTQLSGPGSYAAGHEMGNEGSGHEYYGPKGKALGSPFAGYKNIHDKLARKKSQHEV